VYFLLVIDAVGRWCHVVVAWPLIGWYTRTHARRPPAGGLMSAFWPSSRHVRDISRPYLFPESVSSPVSS